MEHVATSRLIEAAATLDPASRALLNIWLHRGLPDVDLARMAGVEPAAVRTRKLDIIEHLSEELGLPPYEIVAALGVITREPLAVPFKPAGALPKPPQRRRPAPAETDPRLPPLPAVRLRRGRSALGHLTGTTRLDSRARRRALEFLVPIVLVAAVLLVTLLPQGGGADTRKVPAGARRPGSPARADAGRQVAAPPTKAAASRAGAAPRATVLPPRATVLPGPATLAPTLGLQAPARGRLEVVTRGGREALRVAVSGLPAPVRGRYVAWLYTTVIDSMSLGPLPETGQVTLNLPADAGRFHYIDVSFQPAGDRVNSGESVLRAANPVHRELARAERSAG